MGIGSFFKSLKSLVNPEAMGDEIIALQEQAYREAERMYPDAEPHLLLAQVWLSRMAAHGKNPMDQTLQTLAFSETMQFACVPPPKNVRALALYFIHKELPVIIELHPKFGAEFVQLMAPVFAAMEKGQINLLYSRFNPKMAADASEEIDEDESTSDSVEDLTVLGERIASTLAAYVSQVGTVSLFKSSTLVVLTKNHRVFISQASPDNLPFKADVAAYVAIKDLPAIDKCKELMGDGSHSGVTLLAIDLLSRAILAKFAFEAG